jgi:hypothetical protein
MPSARRLGVKKATGSPVRNFAPQLAITKQCCERVLGNEMALGTLYHRFFVGAEDLENIENKFNIH